MGNKVLPFKQDINHPKVVKRAKTLRKIEQLKEQMELERLLNDKL